MLEYLAIKGEVFSDAAKVKSLYIVFSLLSGYFCVNDPSATSLEHEYAAGVGIGVANDPMGQ